MGRGENRSRVLKRPMVEMMEMLMRRTVMERSEKFELTKAPKAEKNTTKRGRRGGGGGRKMMGRPLLRNHSEELKCSCTPFHRQRSVDRLLTSC